MSHQSDDIFDGNKKFQLERLILFSDAVFAIAITLLVIEIKVPELHYDADLRKNLAHALGEKAPEFLGLIVSFFVIGQFWVQHHRLFGLVHSYDNRLLWLNLHMLFWIVIVPFSSALNFKYGIDGVWMWYSFNMFMVGLSIFFLWNYIGNPKHKLSHIADDPLRSKSARLRSIVIALIFLCGLLLCLPGVPVISRIARMVYFLIFPAMMIINRMYKYNK